MVTSASTPAKTSLPPYRRPLSSRIEDAADRVTFGHGTEALLSVIYIGGTVLGMWLSHRMIKNACKSALQETLGKRKL